MNRTSFALRIVFVAALAVVVSQPIAYGNSITTETLNTAALVGSPAGPFSLALVFTDGSGLGDANNTATLSNFSFGGGSAGSVITTLGGVSGDLGSSVSMLDSSFFNLFVASFVPGSSLSFLMDLTTNVDAGGIPDELSLVLFQGDGLPVPTSDPSGVDSLLRVDINSGQPTVSTFVLAVPEPSSLLLVLA